MKLTDAERLILINQYTILSHLRPEGNWRYMAEELEQGFYENEGYNFSSDLQPSIPADRLDLADSVIDLFEEKGWPFISLAAAETKDHVVVTSLPLTRDGRPSEAPALALSASCPNRT
jgi:hypothetical protein